MNNNINKLDVVLDRFSKAHPFADTRAYNVYHQKAKQALIALIESLCLEVIGEDEPMPNSRNYMIDPNYPLTLKEDEYRGSVNYINGRNDLRAEQRTNLQRLKTDTINIGNELKQEARDALLNKALEEAFNQCLTEVTALLEAKIGELK